ncbi:MAG: hypothetical protein M3429_04695, partial [Verrucomicrobiota bacterium]|nr:hypothetical protein [Verrucomicrobiota bacterium]
MNPKRIFSVILLAVISTSLIMPAPPAHSQGKRTQGGTTPAPPTTKTKLEAQEFGGEFQQWVKSLTITSAEEVTFRWMTDQPGVASAVWQVSDKPVVFGENIAQSQAPQVIASGVLGSVPKPGHVAMFDIDFAQFAPKTPPSTPRSYWVFVKTRNAAQQFVGLPSASVKITYRKSTQKPVDFSSIPGQTPKPMPIQIHLSKFTVNKTNEGQGDDDPYLFVVALYA